jgi:predicted ferric reductase
MPPVSPLITPTPAPAPAPTPAPARRIEARVIGADVMTVAGIVLLLVIGFWLRHGGVHRLGEGALGWWTSLAQLSGLLTSLAAWYGLLLAARPRAIERRVGLDRMLVWHRWLGDAIGILLAAHVAFGIAEYASGSGVWGAVRDLTGGEPYMAMATAGTVIVFAVVLSSLRAVRRHLAYETWYFVHLTAYLGFALAFSHQITLGSDFSRDAGARWFWILLNVSALVALVVCRWGGAIRAWLRPLRVAGVTWLNGDTATIELASTTRGRELGGAGQFVLVRALRPGMWWQANPFSLSSASSATAMRITVKDRGDTSAALTRLPIGTRVAVEGPFGVIAPEMAEDRPVVMIAGGVGITPVLALLERLDRRHEPVVLYRAHAESDLVHLDEVRRLAEARGGRVMTLVGPSISLAVADPFASTELLAAIPDVRRRVAFVSGPESMVHAARRGLRGAGVSVDDIHYDRVWW